MWKIKHKLLDDNPDAAGGVPDAPVPDAEVDVAPAEPTADHPFFKALPEDWRDQLANELKLDESKKNVLGRYQTFDKFAEAFFHQHDKIREGLAKAQLPENPTDEQLAEYRQQNGIPETPDAYELKLDDGLELGEADQKVMSKVFEVAHSKNVHPDVVSEMTNAMLKAREIDSQMRLQQHGIDYQNAESLLRDNWGSEYETNINVVKGLITQMPEDLRESFAQAELADGRKLFNSPEAVQWLAGIGRKLNPAATVVPNTANPGQAIKNEINKIEETIRDDPDAYWKSNDMQKRYEQLLEAQGNMA